MNWKKYSLINFEAACLLLNNVLPIWEHQLTFILIFPKGSSNLSLDFGGCDVGAQDPHSPSCWRHIQRMGVQVDKLHQGLSAKMVCPEQWPVVILQVGLPVKHIKSGDTPWSCHQRNLSTVICQTTDSLVRCWLSKGVNQPPNIYCSYFRWILLLDWSLVLILCSMKHRHAVFFSCLVTFPPQKCQIKHLWSIGPRQRWATHVEVQSTWPQPLSLWMTPATLSSPTVERRPITWRPAVKWNVSAGSRPWNWPKPRRHACRPSQVKCKHRQNDNKRVFGVSWEKPSPFWCVFFAFLFPLIVNRRLGGRLSPGSTRTRWRIAEFRSSGCSQNTKQQGGGSQHLQRSNFKAWLCPPEVSLEQPIALFLSLSSLPLPETYTYECLTWKLHFKKPSFK